MVITMINSDNANKDNKDKHQSNNIYSFNKRDAYT